MPAIKKKRVIRLSIMISCYRKTDYFKMTLDSVLNFVGKRKDIEVLICDDGSPAGGDGDLAREYEKKNPDLFKVFKNRQNRGIRYSYSLLLDSARGDYVMPFDCDDILLPFDIGKSIEFLEKNPEYIGSYAKKRLFSREHGDLRQTGGGEDSLFALSFAAREVHNAMLLRRLELKKIGGYKSPIFPSEITGPVDVTMWIASSLHKKLYFENEFRSLYRVHSDQYTVAYPGKYQEDYRSIRNDLAAQYPELAAAIHSGTSYFVKPEEVKAAVILFGAEFITRNIADDSSLELMNQAASLLPEDPGIMEFRIRVLIRMERWSEAMNAAQNTYIACKRLGYTYTQLMALNIICDIAGKMNFPAQLFHDLLRQETNAFFSLTPEQEKVFQQVLELEKEKKDQADQ